ncbi:hypothetical protein BDW59DRAFT_141309 [Aspergillus cavernicola]|uniref:Uncharacterized protein n=1 Tax=Aspergillus cavernicola TaxID=176166 RepID=A0ABR4IR53_9EURO
MISTVEFLRHCWTPYSRLKVQSKPTHIITPEYSCQSLDTPQHPQDRQCGEQKCHPIPGTQILLASYLQDGKPRLSRNLDAIRTAENSIALEYMIYPSFFPC